MKMVMDDYSDYSDYLHIVRALIASAHEPYNLKRIIDGIDSSALNLEATMNEIASEFTLKEITEIKESTEKLHKLAHEKSFDALVSLMDGSKFLFCEVEKHKQDLSTFDTYQGVLTINSQT